MNSAVLLTVLLAGACFGAEPPPAPGPAKGILDPELRDILGGNATETKKTPTNSSSSAPPSPTPSSSTTTTTTEKAKKAEDDDDGPNLVRALLLLR